MSKKTFLIALTVLVLIAAGLGFYLLLMKPTSDDTMPVSPEISTTPTELPASSGENPLEQVSELPESRTPTLVKKKLQPLTESKAIGFAVKSITEVVYFDSGVGQFVVASLSGKNKQPASSNTFTNIESVIWSPDKSAAIIGFSGGVNYYHSLVDSFSSKLPAGAHDFSWSSDGDRIIYEIGEEPTEKQIIVANPDGSNKSEVKDLGYASRIAGWSSMPGGPVSLVQVYNLGAGRSVYPVYINGASGQALELAGFGDKAKYSRDSKRLLYPVVDTEEFKHTLWVVDIDGLNQYSLGVQTFVEKCVWGANNTFVYCAVPSRALGVEPELSSSTTDNFWKINTKTGEKTKLYDNSESEIKIDAENVWTSPTEDRLYFENMKDGKIYVLYLQ